MSRTEFDDFFQTFRNKYPPVKSVGDAILRLTTDEIVNTITDFFPDIKLPDTGITRYLMEQGYKFEPFEVNERIRYFWLIGAKLPD